MYIYSLFYKRQLKQPHMLFVAFEITDSTSQRTSSPLQSISLKKDKTTGSKIRTGTKPLPEKTQAALWQRQNQSN